MVTSNCRDIIPDINKKPKLPEGMGILTVKEYINRNKDKVDDILELDLKFDFSNNVGSLNKKDILYNKMLNNYLNSGNSDEIIKYFINSNNLELIDFIQNYLFLSSENNKIKVLGSGLLNDIVLDYEKQNNILLYLLTDLKYKNTEFLKNKRYENKPIIFLNKHAESKEMNGKIYYKISKDYYGEFVFNNENDDGKLVKIGKIISNKFISEKINNNSKINSFGNEEIDLILGLINIPKIRKFFEEHLLMRLSDIPLKSQVYLFKYLMNNDYEEIDNYKRVVAQNWNIHNEIQQAFFAVSEDKKMSEIILKIADSDISEGDKKNIFDKYNFLVDTIFEEINNQFGELNGKEKKEIFKGIIKRVNFLFKDIDKILKNKNLDDIEEINNLLEKTKKDLIKSGIIFKNLKNKNINSLEELNEANIGIKYKKTKLSELNQEEKEEIKNQIMSLYYQNYDLETQGNFLRDIEEKLKEMFNGTDKVEFYMFYVSGEVKLSAYIKEDGHLGGFNASDSFQEYSFGFWVFDKILEEQKNKEIKIGVLTEIEGKKINYQNLKEKYIGFNFEILDLEEKDFGTNNKYIEMIK